jgi:hypothetical protein
MTVEQMKTMAREVFDERVESLTKTGDLLPTFHILTPDGLIFVPVDRRLANDEQAKRQIGAFIRQQVETSDAKGVISVFDSYVHEANTPEDKKANEVRQSLGLTIEQAANLGMIKMYEAVMCCLETADLCWTWKQIYKHVNRKIVLGEFNEYEANPMVSRFSGMFKKAAAAKARS